jgi:ubiquinone/menaquinone biosynthesis C-methylase UbiE
MKAQTQSVKRAQVEFHNFASLGEPERAIATYAEENQRRGAILRNHLEFAGALSPFLEIGANAGHTSYMLVNEFGAAGYALDISADALRHGRALMDRWQLERAPVRIAGDAANLPFADNSLRMVAAFQMLSQFMDIEAVFLEVKRVLAPGGIFFFSEEPIRRALSLRLYRCPYWEQMKPWERKLHQWGLLGYLVQDVIGAHQEESFGIRQNHRMKLWDWHNLIVKHFVAQEYEIFVPRRGWGERIVYQLAKRVDRLQSDWIPARLLGGTLAAFCRKAGTAPAADPRPLAGRFEALLRCPDCHAALERLADESLRCTGCGYAAAEEAGVYNLLPAAEKRELYPGPRPDVLDFSQAGHERGLLKGFYEVEGVYGNKYRWMGPRAVALLEHLNAGRQRLRIRGHASERMLSQGVPARVVVRANGAEAGNWVLGRPGLFVLETPLEPAERYEIEIEGSPAFQVPPDERVFSLNLSMIRLVDEE